jgi:membrane-associated phospholipid phosphatase
VTGPASATGETRIRYHERMSAALRASPSGRGLLLTAVAAGSTAVGLAALDAPVASLSYRILRATPLLERYASRIPDTLLGVVVLVTAASWTAYSVLTRKGVHDLRTDFLRVCGFAAPAAFAAKTLLQWAFGRSSASAWVLYGELPRFHWFHLEPRLGSFPSGHMTVFTALAAAVWLYDPRHRRFCIGFLAALGGALVLTTYHFLSDVIAGAYLGAATCLLIRRGIGGAAPAADPEPGR